MDLARAKNPMTGKVPGAKGKRKKKTEDSKEESKSDQIDLSTLIYLTQSPTRHTARVSTLTLQLGSLRLHRLNTTLQQDLDYINTLTRSKLIETCNQLDLDIQQQQVNLTASILLDAALRRLAYVTNGDNDPDWPAAEFEQVPCAATLPDLHSALLRVMVSHTASTARRPLAHLMRKALPRRSAGRLFFRVIPRYIKVSPLVQRTVYGMLMASLIGNYKHSTGHMSLGARTWLRDCFDPQPMTKGKLRETMQNKLMEWCPTLFVFVIRDHMIHILEDDSAARKHFDARYDYNGFKSITTQAIEDVRKYIETNTKPGGTLTEEHALPLVGLPQFKKDLHRLLNRMHSRMLRIQAAPAAAPFFQFLGNLRGQVPNRSDLVQQQAELHKQDKVMDESSDDYAAVEEEEYDEEDDPDKEQEAKEEPDEEEHHYQLIENFDDIKSLEKLVDEMDAKDEKKAEKPPVIRLTRQGVSHAHSKAWRGIFARVPSHTNADTAFDLVLKMLSYFGVDPDAPRELKGMWQRYTEGGSTQKHWKAEMTRFSKQYPVTWCNIIAAWIAFCEHTSAHIYKLDWSTSHYQIEALGERFKCGTRALPDTATSLCLCIVCRKVRSLVREPGEASVKQTYIYGLKDVGVDLFSGRLSCRKSKALMHMQCRTQDLSRVNLLGCVLVYRHRLYMHCPQKKCGHSFQFCAPHAAFSARGPACPNCTLDMIRATHNKLRKEHEFAVERNFKCFLCNKRIAKATNGFIFAKGTVVCANPKHRHKDLVDYVRTNVPWVVLDKRHEIDSAAQAVRTTMLKLREETRSAWADHNTKKNNAILKQIRKNKWSKSTG